MNALTSPEPMNFVSGNVVQNWSRWEQQFLTYFVACELGTNAKETHQFWIRDQLENEKIGQWVTELRTRAAKCDFKEQNNMIRDKIVFGVRDNAVQERLLREADLSLERAVDICRTAETSKMQYQAMSSS